MARLNPDRSHRNVESARRLSRALDPCATGPAWSPPAAEIELPHRSALSEAQIGWLVRTIEGDVIPRLLQTHPIPHDLLEVAVDPLGGPYDDAVAELAQMVLASQAGAARRCVDALRAQGVALETIYLQVFAPAARHLGDLWMADLCDFTQVTIGLWRLQQLMHELSAAFQDDAQTGPAVRRAMLVPVPGSQHTLGLLMVGEFFRRGGWSVWGDPGASTRDLVQAARTEWFDLVGFSVGVKEEFDALSRAIAGIRAASLNPAITVMVGGPVFLAHPASVALVGADGTASDAADAVVQADRLVTLQSQRGGHAAR